MATIQFESVVEGNLIRIPEQYLNAIHSGVKVTVLSEISEEHTVSPRAKAGALSSDDFTALKLDTRNFKFDREEANERR
jgi:hypothetical protein